MKFGVKLKSPLLANSLPEMAASTHPVALKLPNGLICP